MVTASPFNRKILLLGSLAAIIVIDKQVKKETFRSEKKEKSTISSDIESPIGNCRLW